MDSALNTRVLPQDGHFCVFLTLRSCSAVVRSAYQDRFLYRYICRNPVLKRYCPLPADRAYQAFVASKAMPHREFDR